jgi:hypothetical protein
MFQNKQSAAQTQPVALDGQTHYEIQTDPVAVAML